MLLETTDLRSRQNVNVLADPAVSQMARVPLCLRVPGRKGGGRPQRPLVLSSRSFSATRALVSSS